jgi:hypothetical protein
VGGVSVLLVAISKKTGLGIGPPELPKNRCKEKHSEWFNEFKLRKVEPDLLDFW